LTEQQRDALVLWLADSDHDEIADQLRLEDARAASKVVRAAVGRLRDRYTQRGSP